jgi:hypothetical protein
VARFDAEAILATLLRHAVEFMVIGGYGAVLQGAPFVTLDIDVTPRRSADNVARLSAALEELDARVRTGSDDESLAFNHDADSLSTTTTWNLQTKFGRLDVTFEPAGTRGYEDLRRDALLITVHDLALPVASLADIVRSKEAAGRDKDRRVLPVLREILAAQSEQRRRARRQRP